MPSTSDNRALFAFLGIAFLGIVVVHLLLPREAAGVVTLLLLGGIAFTIYRRPRRRGRGG